MPSKFTQEIIGKRITIDGQNDHEYSNVPLSASPNRIKDNGLTYKDINALPITYDFRDMDNVNIVVGDDAIVLAGKNCRVETGKNCHVRADEGTKAFVGSRSTLNHIKVYAFEYTIGWYIFNSDQIHPISPHQFSFHTAEKTITIDGNDIKISSDSFESLKKQLLED